MLRIDARSRLVGEKGVVLSLTILRAGRPNARMKGNVSQNSELGARLLNEGR
jgi:hypothetical protein